MGGAKTLVALSVALMAVWLPARAHAANDLRILAREKAAAVALLRARASDEIATIAQARVFSAYLNASTQGEGLRIKRRMEAALATLRGRFGLAQAQLIDRSGEVIAAAPARLGTLDVAKDAALKAGFALDAYKVTSLPGKQRIMLAAPVVWQGEREFVVRAEQDLSAYQSLLKRDAAPRRHVVLTDGASTILADTREQNDAAAATVAGVPLKGLRAALKGSAQEGHGEIARGNERFIVAYQASGDWLVVVVEAVAPPHRCPGRGERLCG